MDQQFRTAYQAIGSRFNFLEHPYLLWMKTTTREEFALSQRLFVHAVEEFPCALAACLAKVSSLDSRLELAKNIAAEHGFGQLSEAHKHTFLAYLSAMGLSPSELTGIPYPIGVRAFNENLRNFCIAHSGEEGAALLGMVEYSYSGVSAQISSHIHERRWVEEGAQKHYAVHAELDVEHSEDLFRIARLEWHASGSARSRVERAMELGAYLLWEVYTALLPAATNRDLRSSGEKRREWSGAAQAVSQLGG